MAIVRLLVHVYRQKQRHVVFKWQSRHYSAKSTFYTASACGGGAGSCRFPGPCTTGAGVCRSRSNLAPARAARARGAQATVQSEGGCTAAPMCSRRRSHVQSRARSRVAGTGASRALSPPPGGSSCGTLTPTASHLGGPTWVPSDSAGDALRKNPGPVQVAPACAGCWRLVRMVLLEGAMNRAHKYTRQRCPRYQPGRSIADKITNATSSSLHPCRRAPLGC
jgi:hypothetical protein